MFSKVLGILALLLIAVIGFPKSLPALVILFRTIINGVTSPAFISNLWMALPILGVGIGIWLVIK